MLSHPIEKTKKDTPPLSHPIQKTKKDTPPAAEKEYRLVLKLYTIYEPYQYIINRFSISYTTTLRKWTPLPYAHPPLKGPLLLPKMSTELYYIYVPYMNCTTRRLPLSVPAALLYYGTVLRLLRPRSLRARQSCTRRRERAHHQARDQATAPSQTSALGPSVRQVCRAGARVRTQSGWADAVAAGESGSGSVRGFRLGAGVAGEEARAGARRRRTAEPRAERAPGLPFQ